MVHVIPAEKQAQLAALFREGESIGFAQEASGLHPRTIKVYFRIFDNDLTDIDTIPCCPCGKPRMHKGWCPHRTARSPARQALLRSLKGKRVGSVSKKQSREFFQKLKATSDIK